MLIDRLEIHFIIRDKIISLKILQNVFDSQRIWKYLISIKYLSLKIKQNYIFYTLNHFCREIIIFLDGNYLKEPLFKIKVKFVN